MEPLADLNTASRVAHYFGVSADTIRRWARDGKIRVITLPSGQMRFRRGDVEALLTTDDTEPVAS